MGNYLVSTNLGVLPSTISLGDDQSCSLTINGGIKCWGKNDFGQLGYEDTTARGNGPFEMGSYLPLVKLGTGLLSLNHETGDRHSCSLLSNSEIKCWGKNGVGQLGVGHSLDIGGAIFEV